jgi:hypothetical protein
VGSGYLVEGLETFLAEKAEEGIVIERNKISLCSLFQEFLDTRQIQLWWDPDHQESDFFDDLQAYAVNMSSRALIHMAQKHAVKTNDVQCLHALHKLLALLFQNTSSNSQYGPSLMYQAVIYEGLSTMDKEQLDAHGTVNTTGEVGKCIAVDTLMETKIGSSKEVVDRFGSNYEIPAVERAIKSQNQILKIKKGVLDSLCLEDLKYGGGTSKAYFKDEEKAFVKNAIRQYSPLSKNKDREKVYFVNKMPMPYANLSKAKVKKLMHRKKDLFDKKFCPAYT